MIKIVCDVLCNGEDEFNYYIARSLTEFLWMPLPTTSNIDTFRKVVKSRTMEIGSGP